MTESTKAKKAPEHPSYETMIVAAISHLKERKGSSRPALKKYILANYKVSAGAHFDSQINHAIRRGVAKNIFSLPKGNSGTIKLVKPEKKPTHVHADKKAAEKKKPAETTQQTDKKSDNKKSTTKKTTPAKKAAPKKKAAPAKRVPSKRVAKKQMPKATNQTVAVA